MEIPKESATLMLQKGESEDDDKLSLAFLTATAAAAALTGVKQTAGKG